MADRAKRVVRNARRRVFADFLDAGATSAEHAIAYDPPSGVDARQFARLLHKDVMKRTEAGLIWYDKAAHDVLRGRSANRTTTTVAAAGVGALAMGAFLLWRRAKRAGGRTG